MQLHHRAGNHSLMLLRVAVGRNEYESGLECHDVFS
jgi:hypothetical protein